jgi:hypothetical protein
VRPHQGAQQSPGRTTRSLTGSQAQSPPALRLTAHQLSGSEPRGDHSRAQDAQHDRSPAITAEPRTHNKRAQGRSQQSPGRTTRSLTSAHSRAQDAQHERLPATTAEPTSSQAQSPQALRLTAHQLSQETHNSPPQAHRGRLRAHNRPLRMRPAQPASIGALCGLLMGLSAHNARASEGLTRPEGQQGETHNSQASHGEGQQDSQHEPREGLSGPLRAHNGDQERASRGPHGPTSPLGLRGRTTQFATVEALTAPRRGLTVGLMRRTTEKASQERASRGPQRAHNSKGLQPRIRGPPNTQGLRGPRSGPHGCVRERNAVGSRAHRA